MIKSSLRKYFLNVAGYFSEPANGIHILNGHYPSPQCNDYKSQDAYDEFIKYMHNKCQLILIQEAVSYIEKKKYDVKHPLIAFTYDDGFEECSTVICPVLEKYHCNAAFFVNSNYINGDQEYVSKFNKDICSPGRKPMTWEQIKDMNKRGHIIGSHTLDHRDLSKLNTEDIMYQTEKNKSLIEGVIGDVCDYFAWPFGRMMHFNQEALSIAKKYHRYIFSATNYTKYYSMRGQVINRRHIESYWPKSHVKYFLSQSKN